MTSFMVSMEIDRAVGSRHAAHLSFPLKRSNTRVFRTSIETRAIRTYVSLLFDDLAPRIAASAGSPMFAIGKNSVPSTSGQTILNSRAGVGEGRTGQDDVAVVIRQADAEMADDAACDARR